MPESTVVRNRDDVLVGPLPASFLRLETRTRDGETVTTVTTEPAQVNLPPSSGEGAAPGAAPTRPQTQQQLLAQPALYQNSIPQAGLSITIAQALLNKSYALIGSMDPYVRLTVGHTTCETFTHGNGDKNPRWNKVYHMPLPNNTSVRTINVEIFDEKSLTEDLRVAFAKITVPERVFQGHTVDEWYPLSGKLGVEAEGSINLIISYTTMPMMTVPYQRIHYPYVQAAPAQFYTPVVPPPVVIRDQDIDAIKDMFPDVDKEVIRTVLESKRGNVEGAVADLLQMTGDQSVDQPTVQPTPPAQ